MSTSRVVSEDLAHRFRSDGAKVFFVGPAVTLARKTHEGFVDEGGRLQGLTGRWFVEHAVGNTAKFLIGGLQELGGAV